MKRFDKTVLKETVCILAVVLICSALMQSVFIMIGKWNYTVFFGNLLGILGGVGNFFLMGITVQSALGKTQDNVKRLMRISQSLRMVMLFTITLIGHLVPCFNLTVVVVSLIFPRIAVAVRSVLIKK